MVTPTPYASTWVDVSLTAIQANARALRRRLRPTTQLLAVVKANAYGHGLLHVADALTAPRLVDFFGVATLAEGIALRNHGISIPILILGQILPEEAPLVARYTLTQTVCTKPVALALARAGQRAKEPVRVHLKVDTGMGRYGVWHDEALAFAQWLRRQSGVLMEGLYTHLANAEGDRSFTQRQLATFRQLAAACERAGIYVPLKHTANSMGVLAYPDSHWDLVRAGLSLYGVSPKSDWRPPVSLKPALSWKARAAFVKEVPPGRTISYGATHRTRTHTTIATLPVGYAHGYSRHLSNRAWAIVRGRRVPIIGRITMDHAMVDTGGILRVRVGDPVTLLGRDRDASVTAEELAAWAGTIPYEILCNISYAVPRHYAPSGPMAPAPSVRVSAAPR